MESLIVLIQAFISSVSARLKKCSPRAVVAEGKDTGEKLPYNYMSSACPRTLLPGPQDVFVATLMLVSRGGSWEDLGFSLMPRAARTLFSSWIWDSFFGVKKFGDMFHGKWVFIYF